MDLEAGQREYIFDWELLLEADIKLADTVIHAQFTKSYMDDTEQWTDLGERFAASAQITESPSTTGSDQSNFSYKRSYNKRIEDKSSEEELDQEAKDRMEIGLPASFGMKAASPIKKKAKRERNGPRGTDVDFEQYWKANEQIFLDGFEELSKLSPCADLGATAFAIALKENTSLIKRHQNVEYFRSFATQEDGSAAETDIKSFIKRDLMSASIAQLRNRAEVFAKKLHQFSFTNGFNIGTKNKDGKFERFKTAQEILSPFESVKYDLHEPVYFGKMKRKNYPLTVDDEEQDTITMEVETEPQAEGESFDLKNFDFSFDPVRDSRLVADNANNVFGRNKDLKKYWHQRYRLFSKLNEGILMDEEGWFSVTPEAIAIHIADRMVTHSECIILDAFTGVGGNAIQFALRGALVYAIDLDPVKIRCARQNAKVYGVEDRITFICGNFYHIAKSFSQSRPDGSPLCFDSIFLSPPWGGPEYLSKQVFELSSCVPDGFDIFETALKLSPNIAYFLPRNTSSNHLMQLAGKTDSKKVEVEHNVLNNKVKALTAYYGNLVSSQNSS